MLEIFKDIIVPLVTAALGFFGGCKYNSWKCKRTMHFNKISGNNNKMINGDNNE